MYYLNDYSSKAYLWYVSNLTYIQNIFNYFCLNFASYNIIYNIIIMSIM